MIVSSTAAELLTVGCGNVALLEAIGLVNLNLELQF
jgi:hypothetical protein